MTPPDPDDAEPGAGERGAPPAVADFSGLDAGGVGGGSVATFDDLDEIGETTYARPDLIGRDADETSPGTVGDAVADPTADEGGSGGPAAVRTVDLDDVSGGGPAAEDHDGDGGAPEVRVASIDGRSRRSGSGRSARPRSERARTSTGRSRAPAVGTSTAGSAGPGAAGAAADEAGVADVPASDSRDARGARRGRGTRSGGSARGGGGLAFGPQDDEAKAKEICLRLLTDRSRTVQELSQALRRKEIPDEVAQRVVERFDEVGLVDDEAFAGQWVRSRHKQRGLGRRAIAAELHRKGVAKEIADEALTEIDAESEETRARELVERKLRTVPIGTKEQRVTAARRLVGMLARKGYGGNIAYRVVKEAIAAHGAEEDELGEGPLDD